MIVLHLTSCQRMDFRIHGETWEPIDFDGLKLIMRPSPARLVAKQAKQGARKKLGFSNASKYRKAKSMAKAKQQKDMPSSTTYVVFDIETTGLKPSTAEITEIGAIKVVDGAITDTFQALVKIKGIVPPDIVELTGITSDLLNREGRNLPDVLESFIDFVEDMPLVAHNATFDMLFLRSALEKCGLAMVKNVVYDTLEIAQREYKGLGSYTLESVGAHLGVMEFWFDNVNASIDAGVNETLLHRSLGDCYMAYLIYEKLMKLHSTDC